MNKFISTVHTARLYETKCGHWCRPLVCSVSVRTV